MERVVGADVARGLAVLGMFTAHLGATTDELWTATGWLQLADGRSAATFALLAGLSAALLSGGPRPVTGARRTHARVRVLVRAALLWPLGALLIALDTPVAVILPGYAVMFGLTALALGWRPITSITVAAVVVVLGPPVVHLARDAAGTTPWQGFVQPVDVLVGEHYPAAVWMAYLLVGLALGRTDLTAPRAPRRLAAAGMVLAVLGYGTAAVAGRLVDPDSTMLRGLVTADPHTDTAPEVVGTVGVVLVVLAASLWTAGRFPRVVAPVAATGALALTAYVGHIVAIALWGPDSVWQPSNLRLAGVVVVTVVLTALWRRLLGRGPLERALHLVATGTADRLVPQGRRERGRPRPAQVTPGRAPDRGAR